MSMPTYQAPTRGRIPLPRVEPKAERDLKIAASFLNTLNQQAAKYGLTRDEVASLVYMRFFRRN